jgi:hypothetical protein
LNFVLDLPTGTGRKTVPGVKSVKLFIFAGAIAVIGGSGAATSRRAAARAIPWPRRAA